MSGGNHVNRTASWPMLRLKHAVDLIVARSTEEEAELPYLGLESIESFTGKLIVSESEANPAGESSNVFKPGDVLFSKLRPYLAKALRPSFAGRCSSELLVLRPHRLLPDFLLYICLSDRFISAVNGSAFGAKMPRADWAFIGNIPVLIPPSEQQRAIADFLDRKTAAIDALIAKKERLLELLAEKRQSLIAQAVTKGLDPNVPMKDSGVEWIGRIPAHWEVKRLKHAARLESGHTPSRSEAEYWLDSNDIPWVSLNDTKHLADNDYISDTALYINQAGIENSSARLLPARIVVFTRDATIGKAAITTRPMAVSQHIIAWICGPSLVPEFLLRVFYAMEDELERLTMGATLRTIGMPDIKRLSVPLPPVAEQNRIASYVADYSDRLKSMMAKVETQLTKLREYRQALITAAVTGQIEITTDTQEAA